MSTSTLYSEKEKTLLPQLRFQEFDGVWKEVLLEDFAKRGSGHTPNKSHPEYYNGEINWISLTDSKKLDNGYIEFTNTKITQLGLDNSSAVLHPAGSVLLSRDAGVGKSAVMKHSMAVSQHFIVWSPKENVSSNWFLYNVLQILKPEFERIAIGNTIKTIGLPYFKKLKIIAPIFQEQQKIASFLSAVDEKIQQLSRKKKLLQQYKKGIMQQLLSGKLRFKDENGNDYAEWEEKKLGECLDYIQPTKYLVSSTEYDNSYKTPVLTAGKTFILGYTNEINGIFENNLPVIIFDDFTTATKFVNFPFKAKSSAMKILVPFKDVNIKFIYEAMQIMKYEIGGHERHWISKFSQILMPFPCFEEQQKIANFLSSIDAKIKSTKQQINQTQTFKKGLLQQLFV